MGHPLELDWLTGKTALSLRKPDGRMLDGLAAEFCAGAILIMNVAHKIESGDTLIGTSPKGFQVGFIVDEPGYRNSLGSIPARFEVRAHRAAPIDSSEPSPFWRRLRTEFEQLSNRQRETLALNRHDPKWLRGYCSRLDDDKLALCEVDGGVDSEFRCRFEDIASQGAIALGCGATDPVKFWVACLFLDLLQNPRDEGKNEFLASVEGGGLIVDLLASAAAYCSRLAIMADRKKDGKTRPGTESDAAPPTTDDADRATSRRTEPLANPAESATPLEFLYERVSYDDPNYALVKDFDLRAWAESFDLHAKVHSGEASLQHVIEANISAVMHGLETQVHLQDDVPMSARCREIDTLAEASIDLVSGALAEEVESFGQDAIDAAVTMFSNKTRELSAIAKRRVLEAELAKSKGSSTSISSETRASMMESTSQAGQSTLPKNRHLELLEKILKNITLEKWAASHKLGRTTVFDWKAATSAGTIPKGRVSPEKCAEIEKAIEEDAMELGLLTRTDSD